MRHFNFFSYALCLRLPRGPPIKAKTHSLISVRNSGGQSFKMDFRALLLCIFLALVAVYAEDAVNEEQQQDDVSKVIFQKNTDSS